PLDAGEAVGHHRRDEDLSDHGNDGGDQRVDQEAIEGRNVPGFYEVLPPDRVRDPHWRADMHLGASLERSNEQPEQREEEWDGEDDEQSECPYLPKPALKGLRARDTDGRHSGFLLSLPLLRILVNPQPRQAEMDEQETDD